MTIRLAAVLSLFSAAAAIGQTDRSIITRALEPAAEDLARLNLVVAWRIYVPVENRGDAIEAVQVFDDQVFVSLQSGRVIAIQAHPHPRTFRKPGDVLWTYRPLIRPGAVQPLAVSPTEVYITQGLQLLVLDRADGKVKYTEHMVSTAKNGAAVDETSVYLPLFNRRIVSYSHTEKIPGYRPMKPYEAPDPIHRLSLAPEPAEPLSTPQNRSPSIARLEIMRPPFRRGSDEIDSSPSVGMLKNIRPPYREVSTARSPSVATLPNLRDVYEQSSKEAQTRIKWLWEMHAPGRLDDTPVLTSDPTDPDSETLTSSTGRSVFTASRHAGRTNQIATEFITETDVSAPLTAKGDMLYVATTDSNFISLSMRELREPSMASNTIPRGKFTSGGPVQQKPLLTDDAIYIVGERWGLMRLKHTTLEPIWNEQLPDGRIRPRPNPDVVRLLSVNSSYAYGLDRRGRLVVVDAVRGSTLSTYDVSAFSFLVTNETTDRLYLASNGGFVICLHDRLRVLPEFLLKPPPPKKAEEPGPDPKMAPEGKKELEPKKELEKKELEKK
jgi:outer membrane protein assembly factor BamB